MRHDSPHIFGYTDRFSARPGETLTFHVSCENLTAYDASLVRLRHGYTGAAGPGFLETELSSSFAGSFAAWLARVSTRIVCRDSGPTGSAPRR